MLLIGAPSGFVLFILGVTSWHIASEDARETAGLVAQAQMLIAVFGAATGLAVALSTIYYAMRNGEMVDVMARSAVAAEERVGEDAVRRLTEATLELVATAGSLQPLMTRSWRWWIPGRAWPRDKVVFITMPILISQRGEALKASEALRMVRPDLDEAVLDLSDATNEAVEAALRGDAARLTAAAAEARRRVVALRRNESTAEAGDQKVQ